MNKHWITDQKLILGTLLFLILMQFLWNNLIVRFESFFWVDNPMHFFGGVVTAAIFLNFLERKKMLETSLLNNAVNILFTVSFVALIGVLWEFYEYLSDYFFLKFLANTPTTMKLGDTLADLFFDLLGSISVALIYFRVKKQDFLDLFQR